MHDQPVPPPEPAWAVFERLLCRGAIDALAPPAQQAVYTPWVVLWLLVYQRLHANASLGDAVAHFRTHFAVPADPPAASTGAYSQARTRLPGAVVRAAARQVFEALVAGYPPSWRGPRVFLVDGTTVRLPPTEALRDAFAPASNQYGRSHGPVRHLVVAHELASGLGAAPQYGAMYGPAAVGEVQRAARMMDQLPPGSVLIGDRNFGVFGLAHAATAGGHRVLVRLTAARFRALVRSGRPAGDGRWSLTWTPTAADRKGNPGLGADASVTGWLHQVVVRADLTLWLFATVDGTGAELGQLYRRRQDVGTDIRDVKRPLGVDQLRGRTVPMVGKELSASLLAYNLATQVRRVAAGARGVEPRRISFAGVWSLVRAMVPVLRTGPRRGTGGAGSRGSCEPPGSGCCRTGRPGDSTRASSYHEVAGTPSGSGLRNKRPRS
ncbi:IS4 family transposase [Gemmata sp. JC717]|uniref:IS4 family transposase n=1 Tax=Gemmata algarum TaxID=2975278 RepID=UPI0021BB921B|nr:IS4 family transposase [Gemmata algarum]MDY3553938.1 IS4 family transposase [Gemmata algarum]